MLPPMYSNNSSTIVVRELRIAPYATQAKGESWLTYSIPLYLRFATETSKSNQPLSTFSRDVDCSGVSYSTYVQVRPNTPRFTVLSP